MLIRFRMLARMRGIGGWFREVVCREVVRSEVGCRFLVVEDNCDLAVIDWCLYVWLAFWIVCGD